MSLGLKHTRLLRVITESFEGKPDEIYNRFDSMYSWARHRGLRAGERESSGRVSLPWIAIYENDAETTEETDRPISLWMPIDGAGSGSGEFAVKDIPHETVAFMIHRGPMSRLNEAIDELFEWVEKKELTHQARVHRVIYLRGVDAHPEDPDWEAEIQVPLLESRSN